TSSTPEARNTDPAPTPEPEQTWTYELVDSATRPASATSAVIKGSGSSYPDSTSLWVGCDGMTDEVVLKLGGRYSELHGQLGLRESVPAGLVVHVLILADGEPVQNVQLDSDDAAAVPITMVVTDVEQVTFQSQAVSGQCGSADDSYAVLGDGYVS
ncbi:MAG: hypothetical protein ACK5H2_12600, partial [Beutenbergiaceae bacterium]